MAKPVEIVLNRKAVGALLRHQNTKKLLETTGKRIQQAAGGDKAGYRVNSYEGFDRSRTEVVAATRSAQADEAKNRTLSRALGSGR